MSYSISVGFATSKQKADMLAFWNSQDHTEFQDILEKEEGYADQGILSEKSELGYPPEVLADRVLGFNGSSIPHIFWAFCAWMVVQNPGSSMYYDHEVMPIKVYHEPHPKQLGKEFAVDKEGVFIQRPSPFWSKIVQSWDTKQQTRAWLIDLTEKWKAHQASLANHEVSSSSSSKPRTLNGP